MMNATAWAVYVADDHGWMDYCPDVDGVFFGDLPDGARMASDAVMGRHVEFDSRKEAEAFAARLNTSGDWTVKAPTHARYGQEDRPEYAVAEVAGEEFQCQPN